MYQSVHSSSELPELVGTSEEEIVWMWTVGLISAVCGGRAPMSPPDPRMRLKPTLSGGDGYRPRPSADDYLWYSGFKCRILTKMLFSGVSGGCTQDALCPNYPSSIHPPL